MKPQKEEIQIEAMFACPMIGADVICERTKKFMIDGRKVTVFRDNPDTGKEETEEFDIGAVKLSGLPAGYFDSKSAAPTEDKLLSHFGEQEFETIIRQLAKFVLDHKLQNSPEVCKELFDYFARVMEGWNRE